MNKESLTAKLLDLAEGRETPETWQNWWDEHETELEALLSRGEFLKLKPRRHGFQWVPVLGSQKAVSYTHLPTVGNLADVLWQSTVWYFWWD